MTAASVRKRVAALAAVWLAAAAGCGGGGAGDGEGAHEGDPGAAGAPPAAGAPSDGGAGLPGEADGGGLAGGADAAGAGGQSVEVNEFLSYDPADSVADLKLWAGHRGVNSGWSYDGYANGDATIVVPLGWEVVATFQNLDANVAHSAGIIEADGPVPASGDVARLAFGGAATGNFTAGFSSRDRPQVFRLQADREGRFRVYCGVPGHGPGGMWIWFEVTAGVTTPAFRTE